jgi:aryl-alcohol dehydrogenase-like predicted oxidoreductase
VIARTPVTSHPGSGYGRNMEQRILGRTGRAVSVVGLGTWQLGGDWGTLDDDDAMAVLAAAVESGITLFDTADVYGDGRSEQLIGRFLAEHADADVFVATKMGRRVEQLPENYVLANFRQWNDRSRTNLGVDRLDLVQLHCPPSAVFGSDEVYDALDTMVDEGRIAHYGVSVETVAQALAAIARPHVASIQIIFNAFRQKPLDEVLPAAQRDGVGILARVPLASGLLSGRYRKDTAFAPNDHRNFNRHGEAFDVGETFAGVDFETGVEAAQDFAALSPTPAALALRWVIDQPGVTAVIPGARNAEQAAGNASAADLPTVDGHTAAAIKQIYDERIRPLVHDRW